ncbi:response regulator [Lusitaniella coriacea LEGE 07157]|uniref:Response regulator n=1 Tax=Lusitaniella coriacea LEGE 07157 TaxID=945747 RepID=A0A8J7DYV6_9CYAN|nr:adenylate/guanylate cyclase domain-containing protein [Lusitaniella coriacea]MBE9118102.1 response regulator [Lusitaniella coriacea LEGE 07157]
MNQPVIICVDDQPTVLSGLKRELKNILDDEYEIEVAEGGKEALVLIEELRAENQEIVLVISDHIMPDIMGDELLQRIHEILPKTIKIMLTGHADLVAVTNAINHANLYRYIPKPWQPEDLKLTIREALNSYFQNKKLEEQNAHLRQLNQSFSRFVPRQFLQCLNKESILEIELGDNVHQEMSVLFADIRNFTSFSEKMSPEDNFRFINGYLLRMEPAILENQGFIDKYIGDAIMALFRDRADDAVQAGISMLQRLKTYNQERRAAKRLPLQIGIGINTGNLMLGTVGGHNRMDSTVISDAVNLASRLERLTKFYGVSLLISYHTLSRLQEPTRYALRLIDQVSVKGKMKRVSVFEIFDADSPELRSAKLATKPLFEQALIQYYLGHFKSAQDLFQECLGLNPADRVATIYLRRCQTSKVPGRDEEIG